MENNFITLIALIAIVCFIICGVKAALWMDDNFFDPDRSGTTDHWHDFWLYKTEHIHPV